MKTENSRPWYKTWWGILFIVIPFWPVTLPYLIWAKSGWGNGKRILATFGVFIGFMVFIGISNGNKMKSDEKYQEVSALVEAGDIDSAKSKLTEYADDFKYNSYAKKISEEINNVESEEFLKQTYLNMSQENFDKLSGEMIEKKYLTNEVLNALFLTKLKDNLDKGQTWRDQAAAEQAEAERIAAEEQTAAEREEKIKKQFSVWDGSHIALTKLVKSTMYAPNSYEHISTNYGGTGDIIFVITNYRGKNLYGGMVPMYVKARYDLDGNLVEIVDDGTIL